MNESSESSQKQRDDILARLINRSRLSRGLPSLDDTAFVLMLATWRETLSRVPTERLEKCYRLATEDDSGKKPFGAVNVLRAWKGKQGVQGEQARGRIGVEGCCSQDGFVLVDATGSKDIPVDYRGHTYVKTCPIHRPFGMSRHPDPDFVPAPRVGHREAIRQAEIFRRLNPSHKVVRTEGESEMKPISGVAKKILKKVSEQEPLFPPRVGN